MVDIALYQPDIAQNVGTLIRTAACFDCPVHIILPCGFPFDDRRFRRAGMDYIQHTRIIKHLSWSHFVQWAEANQKRIILLTTQSTQPYTEFSFQPNDIILAGRESAGVPETVHHQCNHHIVIPMQKQMRSLNVAVATSIILSESIRQTSLSTAPV